jgi:hypothetical protein
MGDDQNRIPERVPLGGDSADKRIHASAPSRFENRNAEHSRKRELERQRRYRMWVDQRHHRARKRYRRGHASLPPKGDRQQVHTRHHDCTCDRRRQSGHQGVHHERQ